MVMLRIDLWFLRMKFKVFVEKLKKVGFEKVKCGIMVGKGC